METTGNNYRASEYRVGVGSDDKAPVDGISDKDLKLMLAEADKSLTLDQVDQVVSMRKRFQVVLLGIMKAHLDGDAESVSILARTLQVGLGNIDPRMSDDELAQQNEGEGLDVSRSWFNG